MKKDYFVYNAQDRMVYHNSLTKAQAEAELAQIAAEYPDDAHLCHMASVSDDPLFAANIFIAHINNW